MRDFNAWLNTFKDTIADYKYYTDFEKVYKNVDEIKVELNILNSLIGSNNIENDFLILCEKYPEILKCIPILLAVRCNEIKIYDKFLKIYDFKNPNYTTKDYAYFMQNSGLFELISKKLIANLYDYVLGIEVGLDSNARKNRGGHLMENIVENYLKLAKVEYFKEIYVKELESKFGVDLSVISNDGKSEKRFDYAVKTDNNLYLLECNFYASSGSKLNETARSYEKIALECKNLKNIYFVWLTDGKGWFSAKNNLLKTFEKLEHIYNLNDLENGIFLRIFK